jgi:hypothetical protein
MNLDEPAAMNDISPLKDVIVAAWSCRLASNSDRLYAAGQRVSG